MKNSQKFQRPARSSSMPPAHLGEPVVERAEQREDGAADQHVVEVRHDEVGVVDLGVERHGREHDAGQAAEHEDEEEAEHEQERRLELRPAVPQRRDPAEDLDAARDRDQHARGREEAGAELRQPGREHVMDPEPEREEAGGDQREHDRRVAEHGPAREGGDDRRHEAEARQEDDVDLGMAEEPEQVLPQESIAAFGGIVRSASRSAGP